MSYSYYRRNTAVSVNLPLKDGRLLLIYLTKLSNMSSTMSNQIYRPDKLQHVSRALTTGPWYPSSYMNLTEGASERTLYTFGLNTMP